MKIIGRKPVLEALKSGENIRRVMVAINSRGRIIGEIISAAKSRDIRIDRIPPNNVKRSLGEGNHQGVAAELSPVKLHSLTSILRQKVKTEYSTLIALDKVTDPYHIGAVARSALGAECDGLVLPQRNSGYVNETSVKTSAGALLKLPVIQVKNLSDALIELKDNGWWVYGTAGGGDKSIWDFDWPDKVVMVVGSEGKGISQRIANICDDIVTIPISNELESLSVSSAASVVLFEILRSRQE